MNIRTRVTLILRTLGRTAAVALALGAGASSCASLPVPLPGGRQLASRTVARKEAEDTVVADDGGKCRVSADKFAKIGVGDTYRCIWHDPDYQMTAPTESPAGLTAGPPQPQGGRRPNWP